MESYVVGFKLFDAKALQIQDGLPCDAFVIVQCCGQVYQSQTKEECQQLAPFNESCTWPNIELHPKQFESAFIEFKVFSRHWFTRNFLIGKASLQLSFVNARPNKLYARRMLCLRRDDDSAVTGMLDVSVFVLKPKQAAPSAELLEKEPLGNAGDGQEQEEDELLSKAVMTTDVETPPGKPHHLEINIHCLRDLPLTPTLMGEVAPSPYVTVEFVGLIMKTPVSEQVTGVTLNTQVLLPVVTPLYEDTIILKLWNHFALASDVLMAQGLISFSELRNNSLPPTWFHLYGWDPLEVPDPLALANSGRTPEANFFRGSLLVSGRVHPLDEPPKPAAVGMARPVPYPNAIYVCLLADVYVVLGVDARTVAVELSFGVLKECTEPVSVSYGTADSVAADPDDDDAPVQEADQVSSFMFNANKGRIKAMLVQAPEEAKSQPCVMLNVYTGGWMSGRRRAAYCKMKLEDIPQFEVGNPSKPKFYPLTPAPGFEGLNASLLITIEKSGTDDILRNTRKIVKPMMYVVRSYCFLARNVEEEGSCSKRYEMCVQCAGTKIHTKPEPGPRPRWMMHVDLQATLFSDSAKEPPFIEPIVLTVRNASTGQEVGKATCVYTHMRQKDNLGKWEPYTLTPQWVKMMGANGKPACECLIAFEILQYKYKDEPELLPRPMMPVTDNIFQPHINFSTLKKATLHVSLLGLRDLLPISRFESNALGGMVEVCKPVVTFQVAWGDLNDKTEQLKQLRFEYVDVVANGDKRRKQERLESWTSKCGPDGSITGKNFEFLQVKALKVEIPAAMILQPYVIIRVFEVPSRLPAFIKGTLDQLGLGYQNYLVGESRRSLANSLPVCWLEGVTVAKSLPEQQDIVHLAHKKAKDACKVFDTFTQPTLDELGALKKKNRSESESRNKQDSKGGLKGEMAALEGSNKEFVNSTGLPIPLRPVESLTTKRMLPLTDGYRAINVEPGCALSPRLGEKVNVVGQSVVKTIQGKLETEKQGEETDYFYSSLPLMQDRDMVDSSLDFFYVDGVKGFVKCTFKLVDGWDMSEDEPEDSEKAPDAADAAALGGGGPPAEQSVAVTASLVATAAAEKQAATGALPNGILANDAFERKRRVYRSYDVGDALDKFAFDEKKLRKRYKDPEMVPSRVRVRVYIVKAVCIYGKGENDFPDPYVSFHLGPNIHVSFKSQVNIATSEPSFHLLEERDVVLPDEGKLTVMIHDVGGALDMGDTLIGSTTLDLEDRWQSSAFRLSNEKRAVPRENRPLEIIGKTRGSIEMWVEMVESSRAGDVKATQLIKPPEIEIELRFVIWTTSKVKLVKEEYTNVHIISTLNCDKYLGQYPARQETDVHYTCSDGNAVFNWRLVYPRIKMPIKTCTLKMDLYHYELLGNTAIGSLNLDLKKYVERVANTLDAVNVPRDMLKFTGFNQDPDHPEEIGNVSVEFWAMTQGEANGKMVGIAREDPNDHPPLIEPAEGRDWGSYFAGFAFSMPDFGMWKKLIPLFIIMLVFLVAVIGMKQMGLL